jgi:hypothetical protein
VRKKDKKAKRETKFGKFEKLQLWQELRKNGGRREPPRKPPNSKPPGRFTHFLPVDVAVPITSV